MRRFYLEKRTMPHQGASNGDDGQKKGGTGRLARSKLKRDPDQNGQKDNRQVIVAAEQWKVVAENYEAKTDKQSELKGGHEHLLPRPPHVVVSKPQDQHRREQQSARRVPEPPRGPHWR